MEVVGPGATVVLVSDHGFQALHPDDETPYMALRTQRLEERLTARLGEVEVIRTGAKLVITAREDRALGDLETALSELTDEQGQPFFLWERLPDSSRSLGVSLRDRILDPTRLVHGTVGGEPLGDYVVDDSEFTGQHHIDGVFLAAGPGIAAGTHLQGVGLLDVAPTLQILMGIAPANDLPGRAVLGEPTPGPPTRNDLVRGLDYGESRRTIPEDALRALGYVE